MLHVGCRFNRYVASYAPSLRYSVRFLSSGPTLSVLGMLPLTERFEIHGRAGLFFSDTRVRDRFQDRSTGAFQSTEPKSSDQDLMLGIGAAWSFSASYSLRVELARFMDVGKEGQIPELLDINVLHLSVLFR